MNKSKLVSNTQIYLDSRKLLDVILDVTPNFPRAYKYTIGNKMHEIAIALIRRFPQRTLTETALHASSI